MRPTLFIVNNEKQFGRASSGWTSASLTERDICTKFILPAVKEAGWDMMLQVREEVFFTKGRITVRGKLVARGTAKKADVVLCYKPISPSR